MASVWPLLLRCSVRTVTLPSPVAPASASRFEEFDGIPVGIEELYLLAAGTADDVAAKSEAGFGEFGCSRREIIDSQHQPVPSPWLLRLAVREIARTRAAGSAEKEIEAVAGDGGESRAGLMLQSKTEMRRVKGDRSCEVTRLIANAVHVKTSGHAIEDSARVCTRTRLCASAGVGC